mmetsp:Transcript_61771/g.166639  ORF Transcript_61771/g.166639 Transcript_61771/m.166639 type:complete len:568 (-) Transcript_61771:269-1972(-)
MPLQLVRGNLRLHLNVLVGQGLVGVKKHQDAHLVGRDVKLVPGLGHHGLDVREAVVRLPGEAPACVLGQVKGLKAAAALLHLRRHLARRPGRPGPEPRGQHRDLELDAPSRGGGRRQAARCSSRRGAARPLLGGPRGAAGGGALVLLHQVLGELHVLEHALQLGGVLMAALALQFGDHTLLCLVADAAPRQQAPGEVLLVEVFKHVLVLQEAEDGHHLFQVGVDLYVAGHALEALPEHIIHEQGQVLGGPRVLVQEAFERLLLRNLELLVLLEGLLHELIVLVLQGQDRRDEGHGILDLFRVVQDISARLTDAVHHYSLHLLERCWHPAKQEVHPLEVLHLVVLEHPRAPRVLHVNERAAVHGDPLAVAQILHLLHGGLVQVVLHPRFLLSDALLGLLQVIGARVLRNVLHRLVLIELPRGVEELLLEALPVDALALDPQLHEHVHRVLQEDLVHLLAPPLRGDVVKHQGEQPRAHPLVARHVLAEDDQAHLVDWDLLVLRHEIAIHVHQDVTDHDHGGLVVVPLLLQLLQQRRVRAVDAALRDRLQVVRDHPLHAIVEQFAVLVQY